MTEHGITEVFCFQNLIVYLTPCQAKDRQKRKQPTKGIRLDAEGDASLEDLTNVGSEGTGNEPNPDSDRLKSTSKKVSKFVLFSSSQNMGFNCGDSTAEREENNRG